MAERAVEINRHWPGKIAALGVAICVLGPLFVVMASVDSGFKLGASDWAALEFTVLQAALSAVLSVGLAIPVARALARRSFPGRSLLITLLGAPFILPVIVAVLGLLAVFGRNGILSTALGWFGLPPIQVYGLHGVVLAHVFFNLPLAARMILQGWQTIPAERFRLAASLGFGPGQVMRILEWPMLVQVVPGALMVIFSLCLSSFAVALTLGGGPRATTVELAIYQAFRFDFDLGRAALLASLQLLLAGSAAIAALAISRQEGFGAGLDRPVTRRDARSGLLRLLDVIILAFAALFLLAPLAMIFIRGVAGILNLPGSVWKAAGVSLTVSLAATAITVGLSLLIASTQSRRTEIVGILGLAVSPLVIGTGLFLLINPFARPGDWALVVTTCVNALTALPFALRVLAPALRQAEADFGKLAESLSMRGFAKWRWVYLPRMRRPLGFAAGLIAALSMGDLGVVALFADPDRATLPLQMYRLMGSYQMAAAASAGLLLLLISLALFWVFDRGGRVGAET